MPATPHKPVLLTGASGTLGQVMATALSAAGWTLRLTDLVPYPQDVPKGATFVRADLEDGPAILRMAEGCGTILHFGGISVEHPFETVIGPNIRGLYHVYEAARREGARMVFASSNHTVGFHSRQTRLDDDSVFRPDGYYGLSKAYGELMGRLYRDKHGVESVFLRIGSCRPEPTDNRMLRIWLSHDDLVSLIERCTLAPDLGPEGCVVIWGASANTAQTWWGEDGRAVIDWTPKDNAERFTDALKDKRHPSAVAEAHQGGPFCVVDYTRKAEP